MPFSLDACALRMEKNLSRELLEFMWSEEQSSVLCLEPQQRKGRMMLCGVVPGKEIMSQSKVVFLHLLL